MGGSPGPRVFVGVDRSVPGLAALRFAVAQARGLKAPLYAVRVEPAFLLRECLEVDAAFADAFGGAPEDIEIHREVLVGSVADALTRRAHYATDILVVGTSGNGRRRVFGFGSISRACLRKARCPVLVVPSPDLTDVGPRRGRARPRQRRSTWSAFGYGPRPVRG